MRGRGFWIGFAVMTFVIAGALSYLASSSPDALDSTTLKGCDVIETAGGEQLTGSCIAQTATDHTMAGSPLADYSVAGMDATGLAGVIGVLATLAVAGGLFWLIARGRSSPPPAD